jgi:hypothetical protein
LKGDSAATKIGNKSMAERLCWEFGRVFRFLSFSITYQVNTPSELSMRIPLLPVELEKEIFQMAAYSGLYPSHA